MLFKRIAHSFLHKGWSLVLAVAGCATAPTALAAPTDCVGDSADGEAVCSAPDAKEWNYRSCDGYFSYQGIEAMWCEAAGGTPQGLYVPGEGNCRGAMAPSEETLVPVATSFMKKFRGESAALESDTNWGSSPAINYLCEPGGLEFSAGKIARQSRILRYSYETVPGSGKQYQEIFASRSRDVICPAGTTARHNNSGQLLGCAHPIACDDCKKVGNPILPGTGLKVQTEVDGVFEGRPIKRHHASRGAIFRNTAGVPLAAVDTETGWRTGFDYWLQPWAGNPYIMASVSTPDGSIQYFRTDGRAHLATNKKRLRLVQNGSNGYFMYSDNELLQFDAEGRLLRLAEASGRVLDFRYSSKIAPNKQPALGPDSKDYYHPYPQPQSQPDLTLTPSGTLIGVKSSTGRSLVYQRDSTGRVTQLYLPGRAPIRYFFNGGSLLGIAVHSVQAEPHPHPEDYGRFYGYTTGVTGASFNGLTSISEGAAQSYSADTTPRYATFKYDAAGLPVSTEHAGGVEKFELDYSVPLQTTVTDPRGAKRVMAFANPQGVVRSSTTTQVAGSGSPASSRTEAYDANGDLASVDDFNGRRTCLVNDGVRRLETVRVEGLGAGTACAGLTVANAALPANSRKITTQWHPHWTLSVKTAGPGRIVTQVYNGQPDPFNGNAVASCAPPTALLPDGKPIAVLCKRVEQATTDANGALGFTAALQAGVAARQTSWTYNAMGQVLSENGPRTDVNDLTTYEYYTDTVAGHTLGDLKKVTNPSGKFVQFTKYNPQGLVLESVDVNGVTTVNTYDPRERLKTVSVAGRVTKYDYDMASNLKKVTFPNTTWLGMDYDAANRQTAVYDHLGNRIDYTLDSMGERIGENTKDPGGTLRRQLLRSMDILGRVQKTVGRE